MSRSATTALTAIEQDAARYRALQRFLLGLGNVITLDNATKGERTMLAGGADVLDRHCDETMNDEDVASVVGQPVSLHVRAEVERERHDAKRALDDAHRALLLVIKASGGEIAVPFALVCDLPKDLLLCTMTDHENGRVVYSVLERAR